MLLQWLSGQSLTFDEINKKFQDNTFVKKTISQDSLWIYLNTLRMLGCEVSRPSLKNNFRYRVTYHPFNHFITSQDTEFLKEILITLSEQLDYRTIFYLIRWIQKTFQNASNKNRKELEQKFFNALRMSNLEKFENILLKLEYYCQNRELLQISYQSKLKGKRQIIFLPQKIFHNQLTFYVLGNAADKDKASMLRLDKIESLSPCKNTELLKDLLETQSRKKTYIIRMINCCRTRYEPLGEEEETLIDPFSEQHIIVKFKTANEFLLTQKLLETGCCFQVLHPKCFKDKIRKILLEMRFLYHS